MFIDANIFIQAYAIKSQESIRCIQLLKKIDSGEQNAFTSPLVMDEVLYYILENKGIENAEKVWNNVLKIQHLEFLSIDKPVMGHVLGYVKNGMAPRDAFHASTMKVNGIGTICSYDKGFDTISGIKRQEPK